jgi:hypothetical protein
MKDQVKTVKGPKAAIATFVRQRDNQRIYVFRRPKETVDQAITRVKRHNGSENVVHELIVP